MSRKIQLTESTVERTARLLSRQHGINVVWKTGECKTDGKTIYLPTLPKDAPDELLRAIHGFLDHETAHILFTDFKVIDKSAPHAVFACINAVEDLRIEAKLCSIFPGSKSNLNAAVAWITPKLMDNWDRINQFTRALTAYIGWNSDGEDTDFWKFCDPTTKALVAACELAAGPCDTIRSTKDAISAGKRVYEVLKEFAPEEEAAEKKRRQQAAQNIKLLEHGGAPIAIQPESLSQLGELLGTSTAIQIIRDAPTSSRVGYQHLASDDRSYLVYSTAGDSIKSVEDGNLSVNGSKLKKLREESRSLTTVIRTRLVNSLRAQAKRRWVGSKEEGKLDTKRMYAAALGVGTDVYKQQTSKLHMNTAVMLAIDHSGSMHGRRLELAAESAIVVGDALSTLRVPFAVYGYSTEQPAHTPKDPGPYARWGSLWIRYYRDFSEAWEKGAVRLAGADRNVRHNTLDAESVKHGIRRLLERPEKRKILFVFNDGMPFPGYGNLARCQRHLLDVVAAAATQGVEIVAFGIQSDDVKVYYPNHLIIQDLVDLTKEPLKMLDTMLRKGVTKC